MDGKNEESGLLGKPNSAEKLDLVGGETGSIAILKLPDGVSSSDVSDAGLQQETLVKASSNAPPDTDLMKATIEQVRHGETPIAKTVGHEVEGSRQQVSTANGFMKKEKNGGISIIHLADFPAPEEPRKTRSSFDSAGWGTVVVSDDEINTANVNYGSNETFAFDVELGEGDGKEQTDGIVKEQVEADVNPDVSSESSLTLSDVARIDRELGNVSDGGGGAVVSSSSSSGSEASETGQAGIQADFQDDGGWIPVQHNHRRRASAGDDREGSPNKTNNNNQQQQSGAPNNTPGTRRYYNYPPTRGMMNFGAGGGYRQQFQPRPGQPMVGHQYDAEQYRQQQREYQRRRAMGAAYRGPPPPGTDPRAMGRGANPTDQEPQVDRDVPCPPRPSASCALWTDPDYNEQESWQHQGRMRGQQRRGGYDGGFSVDNSRVLHGRRYFNEPSVCAEAPANPAGASNAEASERASPGKSFDGAQGPNGPKVANGNRSAPASAGQVDKNEPSDITRRGPPSAGRNSVVSGGLDRIETPARGPQQNRRQNNEEDPDPRPGSARANTMNRYGNRRDNRQLILGDFIAGSPSGGQRPNVPRVMTKPAGQRGQSKGRKEQFNLEADFPPLPGSSMGEEGDQERQVSPWQSRETTPVVAVAGWAAVASSGCQQGDAGNGVACWGPRGNGGTPNKGQEEPWATQANDDPAARRLWEMTNEQFQNNGGTKDEKEKPTDLPHQQQSGDSVGVIANGGPPQGVWDGNRKKSDASRRSSGTPNSGKEAVRGGRTSSERAIGVQQSKMNTSGQAMPPLSSGQQEGNTSSQSGGDERLNQGMPLTTTPIKSKESLTGTSPKSKQNLSGQQELPLKVSVERKSSSPGSDSKRHVTFDNSLSPSRPSNEGPSQPIISDQDDSLIQPKSADPSEESSHHQRLSRSSSSNSSRQDDALDGDWRGNGDSKRRGDLSGCEARRERLMRRRSTSVGKVETSRSSPSIMGEHDEVEEVVPPTGQPADVGPFYQHVAPNPQQPYYSPDGNAMVDDFATEWARPVYPQHAQFGPPATAQYFPPQFTQPYANPWFAQQAMANQHVAHPAPMAYPYIHQQYEPPMSPLASPVMGYIPCTVQEQPDNQEHLSHGQGYPGAPRSPQLVDFDDSGSEIALDQASLSNSNIAPEQQNQEEVAPEQEGSGWPRRSVDSGDRPASAPGYLASSMAQIIHSDNLPPSPQSPVYPSTAYEHPWMSPQEASYMPVNPYASEYVGGHGTVSPYAYYGYPAQPFAGAAYYPGQVPSYQYWQPGPTDREASGELPGGFPIPPRFMPPFMRPQGPRPPRAPAANGPPGFPAMQHELNEVSRQSSGSVGPRPDFPQMAQARIPTSPQPTWAYQRPITPVGCSGQPSTTSKVCPYSLVGLPTCFMRMQMAQHGHPPGPILEHRDLESALLGESQRQQNAQAAQGGQQVQGEDKQDTTPNEVNGVHQNSWPNAQQQAAHLKGDNEQVDGSNEEGTQLTPELEAVCLEAGLLGEILPQTRARGGQTQAEVVQDLIADSYHNGYCQGPAGNQNAHQGQRQAQAMHDPQNNDELVKLQQGIQALEAKMHDLGQRYNQLGAGQGNQPANQQAFEMGPRDQQIFYENMKLFQELKQLSQQICGQQEKLEGSQKPMPPASIQGEPQKKQQNFQQQARPMMPPGMQMPHQQQMMFPQPDYVPFGIPSAHSTPFLYEGLEETGGKPGHEQPQKSTMEKHERGERQGMTQQNTQGALPPGPQGPMQGTPLDLLLASLQERYPPQQYPMMDNMERMHQARGAPPPGLNHSHSMQMPQGLLGINTEGNTGAFGGQQENDVRRERPLPPASASRGIEAMGIPSQEAQMPTVADEGKGVNVRAMTSQQSAAVAAFQRMNPMRPAVPRFDEKRSGNRAQQNEDTVGNDSFMSSQNDQERFYGMNGFDMRDIRDMRLRARVQQPRSIMPAGNPRFSGMGPQQQRVVRQADSNQGNNNGPQFNQQQAHQEQRFKQQMQQDRQRLERTGSQHGGQQRAYRQQLQQPSQNGPQHQMNHPGSRQNFRQQYFPNGRRQQGQQRGGYQDQPRFQGLDHGQGGQFNGPLDGQYQHVLDEVQLQEIQQRGETQLQRAAETQQRGRQNQRGYRAQRQATLGQRHAGGDRAQREPNQGGGPFQNGHSMNTPGLASFFPPGDQQDFNAMLQAGNEDEGRGGPPQQQ